MWAYPREFGDADSASQITGSPNRFTIVSGYSHMFLLLSGYAILDNPTMPMCALTLVAEVDEPAVHADPDAPQKSSRFGRPDPNLPT